LERLTGRVLDYFTFLDSGLTEDEAEDKAISISIQKMQKEREGGAGSSGGGASAPTLPASASSPVGSQAANK
jgi:hypothetical protein